jgi:hypothetical protein
MLPALDQQLASHLLVQEQQGVELLVVKLRPAAHISFGDFRQPLCPVACHVNLLASTGNGPASVQRLQSNHHSRQTSGDGHITARQFLHCPDAVVSAIHRAQQLGQLAGIAAITFNCRIVAVFVSRMDSITSFQRNPERPPRSLPDDETHAFVSWTFLLARSRVVIEPRISRRK